MIPNAFFPPRPPAKPTTQALASTLPDHAGLLKVGYTERHIDFEGRQFIPRTGELTYEAADKEKPIVCFGSFQDFLQRAAGDAIKPRNE